MTRRTILITTAAVLAIAAFGWFVWPTRWTYERVQYGQYREVVVRINRFTSDAEALIPGQGWVAWTPPPNPFDKIGRP
jgi:hypothetical protein